MSFMKKSANKAKIATVACLLTSTVGILACGDLSKYNTQSGINTVDIPNSQIKWQSIGNCWVYAALGWAEGMVLQYSRGSQELNLSETYITYRYFQNQLSNTFMFSKTINTGGSWRVAASLMRQYGVMNEGDFIPGESTITKSAVQSKAVNYLNESLKTGLLKDAAGRTKENVIAELNQAFGVNIDQVSSKIWYAKNLMVARDAKTGKSISLNEELYNWNERFVNVGTMPQVDAAPQGPVILPDNTKKLIAELKHALNTGHPAMISWFVDFNALGNDGIFSLETLKAKGPGSQGYHMTVVEDYVVSGIDPDTGRSFRVGEGQASKADMELAEKYGEIEYVIIKNSWGGSERTDRTSYKVNGKGGFHRLNADYLFGVIKQLDTDTHQVDGVEQVLSGITLPTTLRRMPSPFLLPLL